METAASDEHVDRRAKDNDVCVGTSSAARRPSLIVGIGGTTRSESSSERALRIALRSARSAGARTLLISGAELNLPLYDPAATDRSREAKALVEAFRACDGLIIASPAYHGTISGMVKNALDYAEDLRADVRSYLDGIAVGCIACGAGWQAAVQTLACLRTIAHCLRGWPTPFGAALNSGQKLFDSSGECIDPTVGSQLELVGRQVCDFARARAQMT